jgi:hypothetical protein
VIAGIILKSPPLWWAFLRLYHESYSKSLGTIKIVNILILFVLSIRNTASITPGVLAVTSFEHVFYRKRT